jgi:hypothetical protein
VETCVPFDPESKGGVEATVKIAKADLVPSGANLLADYGSFAGLEDACRDFCDRVNARVHRETAAAPAARLAAEREHLHPLPDEPYALALGDERLVGDDQTVRFGSVRYSTPPGGRSRSSRDVGQGVCDIRVHRCTGPAKCGGHSLRHLHSCQ